MQRVANSVKKSCNALVNDALANLKSFHSEAESRAHDCTDLDTDDEVGPDVYFIKEVELN